MAEILSTLSIIAFVTAGVCLGVSVFLWFFFNIPAVIGDLSGKTARKSIAKMRAVNEMSGIKSYASSKTNAERVKLTGSVKKSEKLTQKKKVPDNLPKTGILKESRANEELSPETGRLNPETAGVVDNKSTIAALDNSALQQPVERRSSVKMQMLDEVIFIHTDEVIE